MTKDTRRPVVVYRESMLASSEPFITAQGEGLERHVAWYLGLRRVAGSPVPAARDLTWRSVPLVGRVRRAAWKRWGVAPGTVRALHNLRPALVHAHFGRDAAQVLPLVERLDVPLVVTFHGHDVFRTDASFGCGSRSDRLYLARRGTLAASGARFLAVSSVVRDRLLQMGFPAERVELHHIGVDLAGASAHRAEARDPQLVMFAGRLVPHKGAGDLVAAMGDRRLSGCRLLVVGDGPSRMALERDAAARGVAAEFTGFLPQAEVWRLIGRASVVVVPSRTADNGWVEAFGLVAAEAQAAGVPVIASTCGGLPEAVAPSCTGLLFPEGDVGALADRLASVVDDPGVARRLGDEARTWTEAHLNLANQNRRLEDIYEEVA